MELPYIVLMTHGDWGRELIKSAEAMVGAIKNIYAFSLLPDQTIKDFSSRVETVLKDLPEDSIILTDLFGGSTSNIALTLYSKYRCRVLSGLSLGMLIAADQYRRKLEGDKLVDEILIRSQENCKDIGKLLDQS